jgi:hypothetical protein
MENVHHTRDFGCLRTCFVISICSLACCFLAVLFPAISQEWAFAIHGYFYKDTICQEAAQNPPRLYPAQNYHVNVPVAADIVITPENAAQLQQLGRQEIQLFIPDDSWHPSGTYFITHEWIFYSFSVYACSSDGIGIGYIGNYHEAFGRESNGTNRVILQWHLNGENSILSFLDDSLDCITLYNADSIERINSICLAADSNAIGTVSIHPSEPLIAVGESNLGSYYVNLFNLENRQQVARLRYPARITRLDFNDEGTLLGINAQYWWGLESE